MDMIIGNIAFWAMLIFSTLAAPFVFLWLLITGQM